MRLKKLPPRSTATIVQQMNTISTKKLIRDYMSGKPVDLPAGVDSSSFDFDDQTKVDWDTPLMTEAESLIDQYMNRDKFTEPFKRSDQPAPEPAPAEPAPAPPAEA